MVWLVMAAVLAAGIFLPLQKRPLSGTATYIRASIKALPALFLAGAVLLVDAQAGDPALSLTWMAVGLLLCGVGDFLLDLPDDKGFLPGLVSFLLGHLAFIGFFLHLLAGLEEGVGPVWLPVLVVALPVGLFYLYIHDSLLASFRPPIIAYSLVIGAMLALAVIIALNLGAQKAGLLLVGALSFTLSDMLLSVLKFKRQTESCLGWSLNWALYSFGLFGLAVGAMMLSYG